MKHSMPRLINDIRRRNLRLTILVCVVACGAALFARDLIMRPYRTRRAELSAILDKDRAFLAEFDKSIAATKRERLDRIAQLLENKANEPNPAIVRVSDLDLEMIAPEDRPKAQTLLEESAVVSNECAVAIAVFEKARRAAMAKAEEFRKTAGSDEKDSNLIRASLLDSMGELETMASSPCPESKHFAEAKSGHDKCFDAADRLFNDAKRAEQSLSDAEQLVKNISDAMNRISETSRKANGILIAASRFKVSPSPGKLAELKRNIEREAKILKLSTDDLVKQTEEVGAKRRQTLDRATEKCQTAKVEADRLVDEYGTLIPGSKEKLAAIAALLVRLETASKENEQSWNKRSGDVRRIVVHAISLEKEAEEVVKTVETPSAPNFAASCIRALTLPSDLRADAKEVENALSGLKETKNEHVLEELVRDAQTSVNELIQSKPNIQNELAKEHDRIKEIEKLARATEARRSQLNKELGSGLGSGKITLEKALASSRPPDRWEATTTKLLRQNPTTAKELLSLRTEVGHLRKSIDEWVSAVDRIEKGLATAKADKTFRKAVVRKGAFGRSCGYTSLESISTDGFLAPKSENYEWNFLLETDRPGQHEVEVRVRKTGTGLVDAAIPSETTFERNKKRAKGGWLGITCLLETGGKSIKDILWIPNSGKWPPERRARHEPDDMVVSGKIELKQGLNSFRLSTSLESFSDGRFRSPQWDPEQLQFRIYLDGNLIDEFFHNE